MSAVWNYFTKCDDGTFTECNACKRLVSRNGGCTTNMWKHLERCSESAALLPKEFVLKRCPSGSLTKSTAANSDIWRYFIPSVKDAGYVTCKKCNEDVKKVKGNTANLWRHRQACSQLLQLVQNSDEQNLDISTDEQSVDSSIEDMIQDPIANENNNSVPLESQAIKQVELSRRFNEEKKIRKQRSQVWQYFDLANDQCAVCKRCKAKLNRFDGSTSNLWGHANRCFRLAGKKKKGPSIPTISSYTYPHESVDDDDIQNYFGNFDAEDAAIANLPSGQETSVQNKLQMPIILNYDLRVEEHTTFDKITKKLAGFLIKDLPSYDVLKGQGFREFVIALAPRHSLKSTQEMHENVLADFKLKATNLLKKSLRESVSSVSLVIDSWTDSLNKTSFLAVYAYFIDPKLSSSFPCCITLACRTFPVSQLKETYFIMDTVNRWLRNDTGEESIDETSCTSILENSSLLPYRSISFIKTPISIPMGIFKEYTDAESMRTLDCVQTKANQCFKEAAYSCMQGTEPNILKLVDSLIKFLQSDPSALSRLRTIQKGLGSTKFLFLPSDFKKGLQEAVDSLHLLLELKNALLILFETSGTSDNFPVLLQSDWTALILTTNYANAIKEIIKKCENASISFFLPTFFQLQNMSKDYTEKNCRSDSWLMVKPLVVNFEHALDEVLLKYCGDEQYVLATFLDPGLKSFLPPSMLARATQELSSKSPDSVLQSFSSEASDGSELNTVVIKTESDVGDWLQAYAATNFTEGFNPVEYWLNQSNVAPKITEQALRYLAVPACNKTCRDTVGKSAAFNSLQNEGTNSETLDNLFFLNLNFSSCTSIQEILS